MSVSKRVSGFTLIEVIIVVAIVGILAAVAFPSYVSQVDRGYRAEAQGALTGFAQAMERYYTANGTYVGAQEGGDPAGAPINLDDPPAAPRVFPTQAPLDGGNPSYNLFIAQATATNYTVYATPIEGARMAGDGIFGLQSTGRRGWDRNNNGDPFEANETCWKKEC